MLTIGIIGGSGFEKLGFSECVEVKYLDTAFGKPSAPYRVYKTENITIYQLNRHGDLHNIAPHLVNYRANIEGFKQLGVNRIIALTSVGAIDTIYRPEDIVLPYNAIDFTHGRVSTFFDKDVVQHVDLTNPFCQDLRKSFVKAADIAGAEVKEGGIYICVNGPRLETAAEINYFKTIGADIVGMTLFPEVTLARETEICYLNVSIVTNYAAGVVINHKLTVNEITENAGFASEKLLKILRHLWQTVEQSRKCYCSNALEGTSF